MNPNRLAEASRIGNLIRGYFKEHPEIRGFKDLARLTGISYDSLQKYAKGASVPPIEKLDALLGVIDPAEPRPKPPQMEFDANKEATGKNMKNNQIESESSNPEQPPAVAPPEDQKLTLARPSKPEDRQEFYIPIHGFVWFYPEEVAVIDHSAFQRLATINQLGLAYLVYRGATHRRLEHSLGTVWVAQRMIEALTHNSRKIREVEVKDQWLVGAEPTETEIRFIRLAALLHDIGHLPFGHTFEDELHLLDKHDELGRLDRIFSQQNWHGERCPTLETIINTEFQKYLPSSLNEEFTASDLVKTIITKPLKNPTPAQKDEASKLEDRLAAAGLRVQMCRDVVGNTICADLLDYLHRDWFHVGKLRHFDERILHYMEIRTPYDNRAIAVGQQPAPSSADALVIAVGHWPKLRTDGVSAILELLESRYHLAEAVLFHRTKMTATGMLERAITLALPLQARRGEMKDDAVKKALEEWLVRHPEDALLPALREERGPFAKDSKQSSYSTAAARLSSQLLRRQLHNRILIVAYDEFIGADAPRIQNLYASGANAAANREQALCKLEDDFNIPRGRLTMYCPDPRMNKKLAEVRIFVDGEVYPFNEYEDPRDRGHRAAKLSAGHLSAQLDRFTSLWRICFFIDPETKDELGPDLVNVLARVIRAGVLLEHRPEENIEAVMRRIAGDAVKVKNFHRSGAAIVPLGTERRVARSARVSGTNVYPTGAPSLLSLLQDAGPVQNS